MNGEHDTLLPPPGGGPSVRVVKDEERAVSDQPRDSQLEYIREQYREMLELLGAVTRRLEENDRTTREASETFRKTAEDLSSTLTQHGQEIGGLREDIMVLDLRAIRVRNGLSDLSVLVIDNELQILGVMNALLNHVHAKPYAANNLATAYGILDCNKIDVIVADRYLNLGEDGVALLEKVSGRQPEIGLICMSGFLEDEDRLRCEAIGVKILGKPLHQEAFVELLKGFHKAKAERERERIARGNR